MTFGFGWRNYDHDLRLYKKLYRDRHPLTDKEQKDIELWDTIRFYEVLGKMKNHNGNYECRYENDIWEFYKT